MVTRWRWGSYDIDKDNRKADLIVVQAAGGERATRCKLCEPWRQNQWRTIGRLGDILVLVCAD